ncbi:leucyl aminopeptidase [Vulcanisaeta thermophila]|uniref:leucyl aminopeptidase n=1 Tax=Vulcanisaeta thermophila TaxID=867917 RepID=UPI000853710A|nr:leucyl aminopeptidase [Vulcanisaeta thermophila]
MDNFELLKASYKLVNEVLKVRENEEVVITTDTGSDFNVALSIAHAVTLINAKPLILLRNEAPIVGKAMDKYLPVNTLSAALSSANVWIALDKSYLIYSTPYERAMSSGNVRYIELSGFNVDMMIRLIGRVNIQLLYEFQRKLAKITSRIKRMRITTELGTDVEFENDLNRPVLVEGEVYGPGEYMLFGQVDWAPIEESINGVVVVDGTIWPPIGVLHSPVKLRIKDGRIVEISGGSEAKVLEKYLRSFNDEKMYMVAHVTYGCHPNARLGGNIVEDERVWGAVVWGFGSQSSTFRGKLGMASSHVDAVMLNATIYGDDQVIVKNGEFVHEELKDLNDKLRTI